MTAIPNPTSSVAAMITSLGGAQAIFATVQSGGCVLANQLAQALAALDKAYSEKEMATSVAKALWPQKPVLTALRDAV